jgi:dihydrofolate reductase
MIRTRTGVTVDGFVSMADGWPVLASMPGFEPGASYGYHQFIESVDAVVMGRTTFLPALGAPTWPWPDLDVDVYVLTSTPLPADTPAHAIASQGGPEGLLAQLRTRDSDGDVHLVGGPKTIRAFYELGALDRFGVGGAPVPGRPRPATVAGGVAPDDAGSGPLGCQLPRRCSGADLRPRVAPWITRTRTGRCRTPRAHSPPP